MTFIVMSAKQTKALAFQSPNIKQNVLKAEKHEIILPIFYDLAGQNWVVLILKAVPGLVGEKIKQTERRTNWQSSVSNRREMLVKRGRNTSLPN